MSARLAAAMTEPGSQHCADLAAAAFRMWGRASPEERGLVALAA